MVETVGPEFLTSWVQTAVEALGEARAEIDALNVFPVPDGDTGTNMYLTMEAAELALATAKQELEPSTGPGQEDAQTLLVLSKSVVQGALVGARGNSGVILSQILRGMLRIDPISDGSLRGSGEAVRAGLAEAQELAYEAVGDPKEGTMLTVIRYAAEAAAEVPEDDLALVIKAAADGAARALELTPTMLPVLAEAGVVDSGGKGIVVILDAFCEVVTGVRRPSPPDRERPHLPELAGVVHDYAGPKYEVMYLLHVDDAAVPDLRQQLGRMGDSLVAVGGDGLWNVHVHVDDAGAPIEAAMAVGKPFRIKVTWLADLGSHEPHPSHARGRVLICVAHGPGVVDLLEKSGAIPLFCEPRVAPSTGEFLAAITEASTGEVVILPSDKNVRPAAEAAAAAANDEGFRVAVLPTRSIVGSLAAVAVHDPAMNFDQDVVAMSQAAGALRYGGVTVASREAMTSAGTCRPGDILGIVGGDFLEIGQSVAAVASATLDRLTSAGGELVTIVVGADAERRDVEAVTHNLEKRNPGVEVVVYEGGQPFWPMIFGVE